MFAGSTERRATIGPVTGQPCSDETGEFAQPAKDWLAWHDDYLDPGSALSLRLELVRGHIASWLDEHPGEPVRVVSACAGQGHDLLGVLAGRSDADRVSAVLLEFDARNVAAARQFAAAHELAGVEVWQVDAGALDAYAGAVPADLVLFNGVFGNITSVDIQRSVAALPQLCAPSATVIWTRTRKPPDVTPQIRQWFTDAGFDEVAFDAPAGILSSVGVNRLRAAAQPLSTGRIFRFV